MSNPFIAEIRLFGFNFAPRNWAFCQGQIMPITQNPALFSILGTNYGGNGTSTFGLPNLTGRVPINQGQGPGLQPYVVGEMGGVPNVTLIQSNLPIHNHTLAVNTSSTNLPPSQPTPTTSDVLAHSSPNNAYAAAPGNAPMNVQTLSLAGGSQAHNNMMPYCVINYCIALVGIFPQRP